MKRLRPLAVYRRCYALLLLCLATMLSACVELGKGLRIYTQSFAPEELWYPAQTRTFPLLSEESGSQYSLSVALRVDTRIQQAQCQLQSELLYGDQVLQTDTLTLRIADEAGRMRVTGVALHEYGDTLAQPLLMPYTGLYRLRLTSLSREPLTGVNALSISLQPRAVVATAKAVQPASAQLPAPLND